MTPSQQPREALDDENPSATVTLSDLLLAMTFVDAWEVANAADPTTRAKLARAGFDTPELN